MADAYCWNGRTQEGLSQQELAIDLAVETGDLMTIDYTYGLSIYNLMLDPVSRRDSPMQAARTWLSIVQPSPDSVMSTATDWLPWIYMQAGDFDRADEAASWLGNRFQEGYNRTIYLMVTASLSWMRGNLKEARRTVDELAVGGVNERWAHVYYPLAADIFADRGRLENVIDIAAKYLSMDVHPTGEAAKLGVLNPLVRAEVDAAIEGDSEVHAAQAEQALDRMRQILEDTPPLTEGSTSVMTPLQNLAFAEAELRRLSEPSPDLWAKALELADYTYFRLYARWRWAEALLQAGDIEKGTVLLREADNEVTAMGAQLMRTRVKRTARKFQLPL
jgi:tetratricopeptide (TPR) repeat protein